MEQFHDIPFSYGKRNPNTSVSFDIILKEMSIAWSLPLLKNVGFLLFFSLVKMEKTSKLCTCIYKAIGS